MKKRKTKVKERLNDALHGLKVPAGFKITPLSEFASFHKFTKSESSVQGKILQFKKIADKFKKGEKKNIMILEKEDGSVVSVSESAALRGLFDKDNIGKEVYIKYIGDIKIKGQKNAMKNFAVAFKED